MGYAWTEPYALHTTIPLNRPDCSQARSLGSLWLPPYSLLAGIMSGSFPLSVNMDPLAHSHELEYLLNIRGDQCDIKQTNKQTDKQNDAGLNPGLRSGSEYFLSQLRLFIPPNFNRWMELTKKLHIKCGGFLVSGVK